MKSPGRNEEITAQTLAYQIGNGFGIQDNADCSCSSRSCLFDQGGPRYSSSLCFLKAIN